MHKSNKSLALWIVFVATIALAFFYLPVKIGSGDVDKNNGRMNYELKYALFYVDKSLRLNGDLAAYIDAIAGSRSPEYVRGTTEKRTLSDLVAGNERIDYGPGSEYYFAYLKIKSEKTSDADKASKIERIRRASTSEIASLNRELFGKNHSDVMRDLK